jgi:HAE1 family hydrophobic/amphiphilic exporter-1
MTTATTVLGLLPMALGVGEGAELRAPLAVTVIGGLLLSTGLTLVAVPVLYTLLHGAPRPGATAAAVMRRPAEGPLATPTPEAGAWD